MELFSKRLPSYKEATIGTLFIDGALFCHTLEDQVREIAGQPVQKWKVPGKTAIPVGRYKIIIDFSNRFKKLLPLLLNVDGFAGVRIHGGNTHENTEGCILVGYEVTDCSIVGGTSRPALEALQAKIQAALDAGEEVWITISN